MTQKVRRLSGVLIDLSGTLHIEDRVIPGAIEALEKLISESNLHVRFVTNTTTKARADLVQRLNQLGFTSIQYQHVLTSGSLTRTLLEKEKLRPFFLVDKSLEIEFEGLSRENPNAIIVGLAPEHFHYEKLNEAFRILMEGGRLIALHEAKYFAVKDGLLSIGPGAFVKGLEYSSGTKATIIGKPSASFFQCALDDMGILPEEAVMVGDDVMQDVEGANAIGIHSVLVRTGKYRPGDETRSAPTFTANDFSHAVEWVLERVHQEED